MRRQSHSEQFTDYIQAPGNAQPVCGWHLEMFHRFSCFLFKPPKQPNLQEELKMNTQCIATRHFYVYHLER